MLLSKILFPFALFALCLLNAPAIHAVICPVPDNIEVEVINNTFPPVIDRSHSRERLTRENQPLIEKWLKKYDLDTLWDVRHTEIGGLAVGGYALSLNSRITGVPASTHLPKEYCLDFQDVTLEITYNTLILLPRELEENSCEDSYILAHELHHHQLSAEVIARYATRLQRDIGFLIAAHIDSYTFSGREDEDVFEAKKTAIEEAVRNYLKPMVDDIITANAAIDTVKEYMEVERGIQSCEAYKN